MRSYMAFGLFSLAVLFLMTGCFQQAGSQSQVTAISQALPTITPIPPSDTPVPPPTDTPTEPPKQEPSELPFPTDTPASVIENQALPTGTGGSLLEVAQAEQNPLDITATAIIERATQTQAFFLTQTQQALFGTPTPLPTATSLPGITPTTALPAPGGPCTHVVAAGDNLFRISLRYNVTINDIAAANGIANPNIIVVGQTLTIPGCNAGGVVTPGATSVPGGGTTYTVQQGDTLFQISLRFGVPVNSIAAANGISNINVIYIGQQLVIPAA